MIHNFTTGDYTMRIKKKTGGYKYYTNSKYIPIFLFSYCIVQTYGFKVLFVT